MNKKRILTQIKETKEKHITIKEYLALGEALVWMNKNGIACYFYERVRKKEGANYTPKAVERINKRLSFSKMYTDVEMYEQEFQELIGDKYSIEYVKKLGKIPQIVMKGEKYCHEDIKSELINVFGGNRVTLEQPKQCKKTIHMYGRCGVFGYAVEDADTISSQLQRKLKINGYDDIRVINHGLWGAHDKNILFNFLHDVQEMKKGDIVIFYQAPYKKRIMKAIKEKGVWYKDLTDEYHQYEVSRWCFYDKPGHMNKDGYRIISQLIFNDLENHNFSVGKLGKKVENKESTKFLNACLRKNINREFEKEINIYLNRINSEYPLKSKDSKCGSIVMNCNPFTKGHRYLVEYASKCVDRLYIFVVEEDRSLFKFEDRYDMVKKGTEDLDNVVVVPSGKFIISAMTFPEYFMKDYVKEKDFDVSMDLDIFGKKIAPALNISIRFAGEEPLDPVTSNYNDYMRNLLPNYGIEFREIRRLYYDDKNVINATHVRKLISEKRYEELEGYVPKSTYEILEKKYLKKE